MTVAWIGYRLHVSGINITHTWESKNASYSKYRARYAIAACSCSLQLLRLFFSFEAPEHKTAFRSMRSF